MNLKEKNQMMTESQAQSLAEATLKMVGPGWTSEVWDNLGWHAKVVSPCKRWKVHPNINNLPHLGPVGEVYSYSAFLGDPKSAGGTWSEDGATPREAMIKTQTVALAQIAELQSLINLSAKSAA